MEGLLHPTAAVHAPTRRDQSRRSLGPSVWLALAIVCLVSSWYFAAVIAPRGLGVDAPGVQQGLFPEWYGSRQIVLHGRDPYNAATTKEIQKAVYPTAAGGDGQPRNQHRFAYPVFFSLLFFPVAILPFPTAQWVALAGCIAATALLVPVWQQPQGIRISNWTCAGLVFAAYPVVLALQLRQPTLMVAALLGAVVHCIRSQRLLLAGILAAVSSCKPQLAIAVLLPLSIWCVAEWRERKQFAIAAAIGLGGLLSASELMSPGWFPRWISTLQAYGHYAGTRPLLADLLGGHLVVPAAGLLVGAVIWISCRYRDQDLLFAISFSVAAFQLLFSFQIYNEVLLLPAALWLAGNAGKINARGQLHTLLYCCTWIVLGVGWAAAAGLSLANLIVPGAGLTLWQLPLLTAWIYPLPVLATLALCAFPSSWGNLRACSQAIQQP